MSQMIVFRLNARPTYSERMTEARAELRRVIRDQLCAITCDREATMSWSRNAYMKNIVNHYHVRIEGWPLEDVSFRNLSDVSSLPKLELLLRGWKDGTIHFCRITDQQVSEMIADPTPWIGPPSNEVDGNAER